MKSFKSRFAYKRCLSAAMAVLTAIIILLPAQSLAAESVMVQGIKSDKTEILLKYGQQAYIKASVFPSNAANKKIKYASSRTDIAMVYSDGRVRSRKVGTTIVTATTSDGSFTVQVPVYVYKETKSLPTLLNKGDVYLWKPSIEHIKKAFYSDNPNIVNVNNDGFVFAKQRGKATISQKAAYKQGLNKRYILIDRTVRVYNPVTTISIMKRKSLPIGYNNYVIKATITPSSASKSLTFTSSNKRIATVDNNGRIKPLRVGSCKITAKSALNGVVSNEFVLTVTPKKSSPKQAGRKK